MGTLFVLAVLIVALCAVQAFALPDNPPTCSLSSNTADTETTAVLTAVSVDTLANAGVDTIRIYENGALINTRDCAFATTCVATKTVVKTSGGDYNYHAVCRDRAGQQTTSSTVRVHFDGLNRPPVIDTFSPATPFTMREDQTQAFRITAHDPDGDALSYEWKVDGVTVASSGTSYDFSRRVTGTGQTFVIAVYVRDGRGGVDVQTWSVTVTDAVPTVVLARDSGSTECDTFRFTATVSSYDTVSSVAWNFGDGSSSSGTATSVTHQFPENGTYTVNVTVTDSDGDSVSRSISVVVRDVLPTVNAGPDQTVMEGETAYFSGSASMPCSADTIQNYTWDFGDGSPSESGASLTDVSHNYTEEGVYTVTLTVCDEDSCASDILIVTVEDSGPTADFDYDPADPIEGDTVNFTDTSTSYDPIVSWEWDFDGDGVIDSTDQNTSWTYAEEGDYNVCLTVEDEDGDSDTHCEIVHVGNNAPAVDLVANVTAGDEPLSVEFTCSITGGNEPFDYSIDFGDGSAPAELLGTTDTSFVAEHTYDSDSSYTATCTVTDTDGDVGSDTEDITVFTVAPVVDLVLNTTNGTEPLDVHADCFAAGGNAPFNYSIDFGDGTAPETLSATTDVSFGADHTYVQNGTYTVVCTVEDVDGDVTTDSEVVDVFDTVPVIDFTWDPPIPEQHENVTFDSTIDVYDTPYTVDWDFDGDGISDSTDEDPWFEFPAGGDYNVTLTVTDNDGSVVSVTHTIRVTANPPIADLYVDPLSGDEPLTVNVTCVGSGGDAPLSYDIDFGDGSPHAFTSSVMHVFVQNGTYNVTCIVTDIDGDPDVDWEVVDVFDTVPTVDFTYLPLDPLEGEVVSFDATISAYDVPVDIVWDFGDGSSDTVEDPTHAYLLDGTYTVTITVTDADGSVAVASHNITVGVNSADVTFVSNTTSGYEPLDVDFACVAVDGNPPYTYEIDFGDGSLTSSSPTASHTYVQNGTYVAVCTVTDFDGDVSNDTVTIDVLDTVPDVSFTYSPLAPIEGDTVDFDGTITAYDTPVTWEWDFDGDGVADSTAEDPSWTFALEGDYNVTLTATDADGSVVVFWDIVSVGNNEPFVNLEAAPLAGPENLNVTFNCTVTDGNAPLSFLMDYGDGSFGTDQVSSHVYTSPGSYTATCTVTDIDGDMDSDFVIINVANNPPVVNLTAVPTTGPEGVTVDFDCNITGGDAPFGVLLDFGDGSSTTSTTASHNYSLEGVYTATCTVTDIDGDIGFDDELINITNNEPVVNLVVNSTMGFEPLSVAYNCTVGGGNAPFTYLVDFGDGTTSTSSTGTHDYPTPGVYPMTCTVTDVDGDWDDDTVGIHVMDNPPVVDLIAVPTAGLEGVTVDFFCNVTGGNAPLSYLLDFGDGTSTTSDTASHTYGLEGVYNATCTVTDLDGDVGVDSELINVSNNPPVVNLVANVTSGLEPLTVEFNCTVGGGNAPFVYSIDFGDGSAPVAVSTAVHTYPTEGDFDATCTVTDVDGDVGSDIEHIEVINNPPIVDLIAVPTAGLEGIDVAFTCNVTGGNAPLAYSLDFGDGSSTTSPTATHNYPLEGVYNASCQVIDNDGDIGIDSELINISNNPPVVNLRVNTTSGFEPLSVNYTCTVGGGNMPFAYVINFGDGSPTSSSPTGTHDYPTPGTYVMDCTVTDVDGDVDSDDVSITVINNPPVVTLTAVPTVGPEGINVSFNCSFTGGNAPFGVLLDFGDGTSTTSTLASHNYPLEGLYNATCTVTDADLDVGVDSELINITNNVPVVNLVTNVTDGTEPLSVFFNCTLVGGGNPPFTYLIDFGDGSAPVATSTASHTYIQNSTYDASCVITDVDGDVSVPDIASIDVFDSEPDTNFSYAPSSPIEGDTVSFTDLSSAYDGIVAWSWDFGDGNTSSVVNPTHTYFVEGVYIVTLTTTDGDGSQTSHVEAVSVGNNAPVVDVTAVPASGTEPLAVTVSCSVVSGGNAPFTYSVLYGDGTSTTSTVSVHTYGQNGLFPVTCIVTDNDGDVRSDMATVTVNDTVPVANFNWTPVSPRAGDTVSFTDLSTAYDGIASWAWDFENDGVVDSIVQNPTHVFPAAALYIVNLTVTDNDGSSAWVIRSIPVNISIGAPIIFGVGATGITNVTANITWGTDQGADSLVEYGLGPLTLASSAFDGSFVFSHNLVLVGLTPNTTYYYNVTSCNMFAACTTVGPFSFTTLASASADVTPPVVSLMLPADGSTDADGNVTVQYGVTDDLAALMSCDVYSNTSGAWAVDAAGQLTANGGTNAFSYVGLSDGLYRWNVMCSDGTNSAFAAADFTFRVNMSAPGDVTPPVVSLMLPADGSTDIDGNVTVQYGVTDDMAAMLSCDVYSNTSGAWVADLAGQLTANGGTNTFSYVGLSDGLYRWNVMCSDGTNSAFAAADFTFWVNTSSPGSSPVVTASALPTSGDLPLVVQFNATVVGGDLPLSFAWDFDNDGATDSTAQNPIYIYNVAGTYTAVVNVSDVDGDWDTDNVTITVTADTHDIAVTSITDSKVGSTAYLWDLIDVTSNVQNQGTAGETVTVQLEVDGVVVNSTSVAIAAGATVPVALRYTATTAAFNTVIMRAVPVPGETDLADQSRSTSIRVWSVEDIVSNSTREIFLSSSVVLAGGALSAFLPVQNSYGLQSFDDLRVELWSSDLGAFTLLSPQVQLVDLAGGAFALVQWDMTAVTPGVYVMSASLGNNEIDRTEITSKIVTVI